MDKKGKQKLKSNFFTFYGNKKGKQKLQNNFFTFFGDKKGMEMWQLVLLILAILLIIFVFLFYSGIYAQIIDLLGGLKRLF